MFTHSRPVLYSFIAFLSANIFCFSLGHASQSQSIRESEGLFLIQDAPIKHLKNVSALQEIVRPGDLVILDLDETLGRRGASGMNLDPRAPDLVKDWLKSYPEAEKEKQVRVLFLTANFDQERGREALIQAGFPENLGMIIALNDQAAQGKGATKGRKLIEGLRKAEKKNGRPKRIIMVDNLADTLEDIRQALKTSEFSKITYLPFQKQMAYKIYESASQKNHFPAQLTGLVYSGAIGGGSGGVHLLKNAEGQTFTFKCVQDPDQMKEEIVADGLYRSLDIPTPAFAIYDELPNLPELQAVCRGPGPYRLADFIPPVRPQNLATIKSEMRKNFVADALLSNWDIVVGGYKNVIQDNEGNLWRIDNGGALRYRAVGDRKQSSNTWNIFKVMDLETMRNPQISPEGAQTYGDLTNEELKTQAADIFKKREKLLLDLTHMTSALQITQADELKQMVRRRLDDLMVRFQLRDQSVKVRDNQAKIYHPAVQNSGAGILIYSKDPKTGKLVVLLGKRIRHNWWSNFGGKSDREMGEKIDKTLADTAVREVLEESLGLLSFTPLKLAKMPSHDIVNEDGILYRLYVAPHPYVDPLRFSQVAQSSEAYHNKDKYGWDAEYTEYTWMPLDDFLTGIKKNERVIEESKDTLKIEKTIIFPPFAEMLQEKEVQDALKRLAQGKTIPPRHTVRERDRVLIQPPTFEEEKERLAETVVHHAEVMGELKKNIQSSEQTEPTQEVKELKGHLSDEDTKKIKNDLKKAPYSQTEGFLKEIMAPEDFQDVYADSRKEMEKFLSEYSKFPEVWQNASEDYKNALVKALSAEKINDRAVFYHAADPLTCFLYDLLSAFRAQLKIVASDKLKVFRGMDHPFTTLLDVEAFIHKFKDDEGVVENYKEVDGLNYVDMGLSVNPFLFGNDGISTSCTYYMFFKKKSTTLIDHEALINAFMTKTGIPGNFGNYKALYQQYYQHENKDNVKLFQILIDPQVVDTMVYTAGSFGKLLPFEMDGPLPYYGFAKLLTLARTTPDILEEKTPPGSQAGSKKINQLQARIFMKPEIFQDPRYVEIKSYWHHQPSQQMEKNYYTALNAQVKQDLSIWLSEQTKINPHILGSQTPSLKKLYQQVYEGKTGLKYTEFENEEHVSDLLKRALSEGNFISAKNILDQNPHLNLNKKETGENERGYTYLDYISQLGPEGDQLLLLLLERGMSPMLKSLDSENVFSFALGHGMIASSRYIWNKTSDEEREKMSHAALYYAIHSTDEILDWFLDMSKSVTKELKKNFFASSDGLLSPLANALEFGDVDIVKKILDAGFENDGFIEDLFIPYAKKGQKMTPLIEAIRRGFKEIVNLFLGTEYPEKMKEALMNELWRPHPPSLFDVTNNSKGSEKTTPEHLVMLRLLIEADLPLDVKNKLFNLSPSGWNILHYAVNWGRVEIFRILLGAKISPEIIMRLLTQKDRRGNTVLNLVKTKKTQYASNPDELAKYQEMEKLILRLEKEEG